MEAVDLLALLPAVDHTGDDPPFEQLRTRIAALAADGTLPAGSRLPAVRALAAGAGLAVNTVARVYRELEQDGVVVTEGRRGTSVAGSSLGGSRAAGAAAAGYVVEARRLGLGLVEAQALVERAWRGRATGDEGPGRS